MKDVTLGFGEFFQISGRGTVATVNLAKVPNVDEVHIDENIRIQDKFYKIRGIESYSRGQNKNIGLLVREIEDPRDTIEFLCLDVGRTHKGNEECQMRLLKHPDGSWYCIDCGLTIYAARIKAKELKEEKKQ